MICFQKTLKTRLLKCPNKLILLNGSLFLFFVKKPTILSFAMSLLILKTEVDSLFEPFHNSTLNVFNITQKIHV